MRKKIAMRWRRKALRRGAEIKKERILLAKKHMVLIDRPRKYNGFTIEGSYKGHKFSLISDDALDAYKLLCWHLDLEDGIRNNMPVEGCVISDAPGAHWQLIA